MMLKCVKALALLVVLVAGGLLAYAYSGLYDVSATRENGVVSRWLLTTVRQHSIHARLGGIQVPTNLSDPKMVEDGFSHYHEMCEGCHLAPGMDNSEIREGLNPQPPVLAKAVPHTTPAELFWIIKNGVRMTGMPAWGTSHDDQAIWQMVAFLEQLPKMTPAEYQTLAKNDKGDPDAHDPMPAPKQPGTH